MSHFHIVHPTGLLYTFMHNMHIFSSLESIRRLSVVRLSTFSNDISFEAVRPIFSILHTKHLQVGGTESYVFYSGRMRTLVAMAHRLIMGKVEICKKILSQWRYLEFSFAEMFIE